MAKNDEIYKIKITKQIEIPINPNGENVESLMMKVTRNEMEQMDHNETMIIESPHYKIEVTRKFPAD